MDVILFGLKTRKYLKLWGFEQLLCCSLFTECFCFYFLDFFYFLFFNLLLCFEGLSLMQIRWLWWNYRDKCLRSSPCLYSGQTRLSNTKQKGHFFSVRKVYQTRFSWTVFIRLALVCFSVSRKICQLYLGHGLNALSRLNCV